MIAGGKVSQIDPESAGLNPAWRNAVGQAVCQISWEEGASSTEIEESISQLKTWTSAFNDVAPNDGAYFNEVRSRFIKSLFFHLLTLHIKASLFEINWQYTFFGSHYPKLKSIKDKYDPYHLFVVAEGVGSEEWNKELTCRV